MIDPITIKKTWLVVRKPGCVPTVKRPDLYPNPLDMVREILDHEPEGTTVTICHLTWNDDLWVDDGREQLNIARMFEANQ